ncbi:hypothetical protein M422DRAFT_172031 [Sphaerobolus stellatus SS14]|uniref:Uncharacterized protein n=1 Tax=Sphaerobolus stellatus (strain SS14) TaxID=990650 RepID=A0A0C9UF20_SPHS4|nr:hypothetical protein M422DRAFT_172031 [Sphaerobolus stellatus SS14]
MQLYPVAIKPSTTQKTKAHTNGPTETKIEQNNSQPKDPTRHVPKAIIIITKINGNPARALVDSGSLSDFMLTTLVDQLKIQTIPLAKPQPCEMAASSSRTLIQCNTSVDFSYQDIQEKRTFDIMNLENYDLILGTPFLFQHGIMLGFNPIHIAIGSKDAQPIRGPKVSVLGSMASQIIADGLTEIRAMLREEASDLCKSAEDTPLPSLRDINHRIEIIDENLNYKWQPSRCPEAHLWQKKRDTYLATGRW